MPINRFHTLGTPLGPLGNTLQYGCNCRNLLSKLLWLAVPFEHCPRWELMGFCPPKPPRKHCLHLGMHGKIELKIRSTVYLGLEWCFLQSFIFIFVVLPFASEKYFLYQGLRFLYLNKNIIQSAPTYSVHTVKINLPLQVL